MDEEPLAGGVANAGSVTRDGHDVLRPSNLHTSSIHRFLSALRDAGFDGASMPVGIDDDGRERLGFIEGDVPLPPYPEWAQLDSVLVSIAALTRRFHDASRTAPLLATRPSENPPVTETLATVGRNQRIAKGNPPNCLPPSARPAPEFLPTVRQARALP